MIYFALVVYFWSNGPQERVIGHLLSERQCKEDAAAMEPLLLLPQARLECEVET